MSSCDASSEPCTKKARTDSNNSGFSFNFDLGNDESSGPVVELTPLADIFAPLPHSFGQIMRDTSGLGGMSGKRGDIVRINWLQSDHFTINATKCDANFVLLEESGNIPRDAVRLLLSETDKERSMVVEFDTVFCEDNKLPSPFNIEAGLSTLIWPYTKEQFLKSVFQQRCLVVHGTGARLEQQKEDFEQFQVDRLIANSSKSIIWMRTKLGAMQYIDASPEVALSGYLAGNTLYFNPQFELQKKYIRAQCTDLNLNFGVERESQGCGGDLEIFAVNTTTAPTGWHFDAQENFSVQQVGQKKWSVVKGDTCVLSNLHAGSTNRSSVQSDAKVHSSCGISPMTQLTSSGRMVARNQDSHPDKQSFVVRPGTVFYHPAGVWHKVETLDEGGSLSINFSLDSMRWSELVMSRVTQLVQASPLGRQRVQFTNREEALLQVDNLLASIKEMQSNVTSKDIMPPVQDLRLRGDVDALVGTGFVNAEHGTHRYRDFSAVQNSQSHITRNPVAVLMRAEPFFSAPAATQSCGILGSIAQKEDMLGDITNIKYPMLPQVIKTTPWVAYSVHHGFGQEGYTSQHSCALVIDIDKEETLSNGIPCEFAAMYAAEQVMQMQFRQCNQLELAELTKTICDYLEVSSSADISLVSSAVMRCVAVLTHLGVLREQE